MKNRRTFIQTSSLGLLGTLFASLPETGFAHDADEHGMVKGAGEGQTYFVRETTAITIAISKADGVENLSICTEEIHPGDGILVHKHLFNDEFFFFQKGEGSFLLDEREFVVREGSSAFVPRGTWHGLKNTGSQPLLFAFGFSPAGFEDYFRQVGTPKGSPFAAKPDEEKRQLAKKYGMVFR